MAVVADAIERGSLAADLDLDTANTRLAAPVLTEHVMLRRSASDAEIAAAVTALLADHLRA